MTLSLTISLGYINIPFIIKSSIRALTTEEEEEETEVGSPRWTFGNIISISYFLQSPPNIYPTLEKHVLQLSPQAHPFEKEQLETISASFNHTMNDKRTHGLIHISEDLLGILSSTDQPTVFTLQIVQFKNTTVEHQKSYHQTDGETLPDLKHCLNPTEILTLCQLWPKSKDQLTKLSGQVYKMASLYGYWDYWRVFEGICNRHNINPDQLVNNSNQMKYM